MYDYLSLNFLLGLVLLTPLLRTRWWLDIALIPMWVYAAIASFSPWYFEYPSIKLRVVIEGRQHFFLCLVLALVLIIKSNLRAQSLKKYLGLFAEINLINTIIFKLIPSISYGSLLVPNHSMNAALNVILLPFLIRRRPSMWMFLIPLIGVFSLKSSTAALAFFSMGGACLLISTIRAKYKIAATGFFALLILTIAILDNGFLDDGGRFEAYRAFFQDFTLKDWIIGRGPSSFEPWSALIQRAYDLQLQHGFYAFLHSDPLQLIWEFGSVFMILILITIFFLLKNAEPMVFISSISFLSVSIFYYPFHTAPFLAVAFSLIKLATMGSGSDSPNGNGPSTGSLSSLEGSNHQ